MGRRNARARGRACALERRVRRPGRVSILLEPAMVGQRRARWHWMLDIASHRSARGALNVDLARLPSTSTSQKVADTSRGGDQIRLKVTDASCGGAQNGLEQPRTRWRGDQNVRIAIARCVEVRRKFRSASAATVRWRSGRFDHLCTMCRGAQNALDRVRTMWRRPFGRFDHLRAMDWAALEDSGSGAAVRGRGLDGRAWHRGTCMGPRGKARAWGRRGGDAMAKRSVRQVGDEGTAVEIPASPTGTASARSGAGGGGGGGPTGARS